MGGAAGGRKKRGKGTPFLLLILNRYLAATLLSVEVLKYMASTSCLSKSHITRPPLYAQQPKEQEPSSNLNQSISYETLTKGCTFQLLANYFTNHH